MGRFFQEFSTPFFLRSSLSCTEAKGIKHYAPSSGDNADFFKEDVFPVLDKVEYDHVLQGGDWNVGMDTDLDYYGYSDAAQVRPKSRQALHENIANYDLIDIYRELHQNGPERTWRVWNKSGRTPIFFSSFLPIWPPSSSW